jgi:hypothetical protein
MTPDLKEKLLTRLFSSIDYMEEFTKHYSLGLQAADDAFSVFEKRCEIDFSLMNRFSMEFRQWKERVIPNFRRMQKNALISLEKAKQGDFDYIQGATGNLRGLSKDMDGIGWDWWDEVDQKFWKDHADNMNKAEQMGDNIYKTLSQFWGPGSILKESITGPIDEQLLLTYLQPGEQP